MKKSEKTEWITKYEVQTGKWEAYGMSSFSGQGVVWKTVREFRDVSDALWFEQYLKVIKKKEYTQIIETSKASKSSLVR